MPAHDDRERVLVLTDSIGRGGAERVAVDLSRGLDPTRFRVTVCVTRPLEDPSGLAGRNREALVAAGIEVLVLERGGRWDLAAIRPLLARMRGSRFDVVHAHKFGANLWGAVLGRLFGVPVVIAHEHTWSFRGQPVRRFLDREVIARLCDVVVSVSNADREQMIARVGVPARKIVTVPNGVDAPPAGPRSRARARLGIGPEEEVIVLTALPRPQKALEVAIEAMVGIVRQRPRARLLLVGPASGGSLEALADRLGVGGAVIFAGPRSDVGEHLAAADVGALCSDFEGMPLAVLEYMAAGLPVVATSVGGVPEIVVEGETGFLVAPRDPVALADRLVAVLADAALGGALGAKGRIVHRREYSREAMVARVESLYERMLSRTRAIPGRSRPPRSR